MITSALQFRRFHGRGRHLGSGAKRGKIYSECIRKNRDFDARYKLVEG